MDKRIGARIFRCEARAQRLGSAELSIVKACARRAADNNARFVKRVATDARRRFGIHALPFRWMVITTGSIRKPLWCSRARAGPGGGSRDTDEWWSERRSLARKLARSGKFEAAYQVVRDLPRAAAKPNRADFHFPVGLDRLRYRNDAETRGRISPTSDDGSLIRLGGACEYGAPALPKRPARRTRCATDEVADRYPSLIGQLAQPGSPRKNRAAGPQCRLTRR